MKQKLINFINSIKTYYNSHTDTWKTQVSILGVIVLTITITFGTIIFLQGSGGIKLTTTPEDSPYMYAAYDPKHGFAAFIAEKDTNIPKVRANFTRGAAAEFVLKGLSEKNTNKPRRLGNKITFNNIKPSVDLTYETLPNGIKEEIILNEQAESNQFDFTLTTEGAKPTKVTDSGYSTTFVDEKGDYLFHFADPFAIDAAGNRTDTAYYLVQEASPSGTFEVSLFVNNDWLMDETRVYPITIDPTIIYDTTTEFYTGQFNRSKDVGGGSSPKLETYYQELPADQNTVGLWHFNEASGNVLDSSGYGRTGTPDGTTVISGKLNNARDFAGTDDISLGSLTMVDNLENVTVEAWIQPDSQVASTHYRVFSEEAVLYVGQWYNQVSFYMGDGSSWICSSVDGGTLTPVQWNHVAWVKQGTNYYIYINGKLTKSGTCTLTKLGSSSNGNYFSTYNGSVQPWYGNMDEIRISNIARSPEEIRMSASRRPYSTYTSPVLDFNSNTSGWNPFTWTELGVTTGTGETQKDATSLIAQWNYNSNAGTTAINIAGSCGASCHGTLTNFADTASYDTTPLSGWTLVNARWTYALMFDGVDDYVNIPDNDALSFGNGTTDTPFSISTWVNPKTLASGGDGNWIVSKRGAGTNDEYQLVFYDQQIGFTLFDQSATANLALRTVNTFLPDKWYYIVGTYDGSGSVNGLKVYVNGVLQTSTLTPTGTYTAMENLAQPVLIGKASWATTLGFDGVIDSTTIYGRELTAAEILSNYNAGNLEFQTRTGADTTPDDGSWTPWSPVSSEAAIESFDSFSTSSTAESSLVSYWPLDEPTATTAIDSKSGYNATPTGTGGDVIGVKNFARGFGGAGYLTITDAGGEIDNLDMSGDLTAMAWVARTGGTNGYILSKFGPTGGGGYAVLHGNAGEVYCRTDNGVTYKDSYTAQGKVTNATSWTHVAIVKTGTSCRVFINGIDQTQTTNTHGVVPNALPFKIGTDSNNTSIFTGRIDEVRVFNAALSAADIQRYMNEAKSSLDLSIDTTTKMEGTGSLKVITGQQSTDGATVGLWHLEETTGAGGGWIKDSSGKNHNGTPTENTSVNGIAGKGRNYILANGGYIAVNDTPALKPTTITLEAWFKTDTSTVNPYDGGTVILDKINNASPFQGYRMSNGGNKLNCWVGSGAYTTGTTLVNDNKWHHGACTYDGAEVRVYVDGKLEAISPQTAVLSYATSLKIGNSYHGSLDEVRISNIARSEDEMEEAYRLGRDVYFSKTISSTNLSSVSSLPFYVAGDRPGTYLNTQIGESAFVNNQPDANTMGLWHFEEDQRSAIFFDYDSFENKFSADNWLLRNSTNPDITSTTAYTGKSSLHMPLSFGQNFEGAAGEPGTSYDTNTYPYMCMAYKIPSTTIANMLILLNGAWRSITMTQGESQPSYAKAASWNPLDADNQWHHKCINLDAQIDAIDGTGTHTIAAVIWHTGGAATAITGEFWIDDFTIATTQYFPQQAFASDSSNLLNNYFAPVTSMLATGGTTSVVNNYNLNTFTSSGTFTVTGGSSPVDALVIAGGGGGANTGSGGGAGGVIIDNTYLTPQAYAITVGAGGGGGATTAAPGGVGGNSSIGSNLTAIGGGNGVTHGGCAGGAGGSGGGGPISTTCTATGGGATTNQGFAGGAGYLQASWIGTSGGGGGAAALGGAGGNTAGVGGGGSGIVTSIGGTTTYYAGGGGGSEVSGTFVGAGVHGGGSAVVNAAGGAGTANTGGGGAGGAYNAGVYTNGGAGGSGRVEIRYPLYTSNSRSNSIGTNSVLGQIGLGKYFDGTDHVDLGSNFASLTNNFTVSMWVNPASVQSANANIIGNHNSEGGNNGWVLQSPSTTNQYFFTWGNGTGYPCWSSGSGITIPANTWSHVAITKSSTGGLTYYLNGDAVAKCADNTAAVASSRNVWLGQGHASFSGRYFTGSLDEVRIDNVVRTPDQIRQAYEYGNRTHIVTIDFGARLDSGNLITGSGDTSFTVDATYYGLPNKGSNLNLGDKIIVRENYNGTTYIAQGTVNAITPSTGVTTVASWDAGSTFPSGGFTIYADVFKWQREYFNVSGSNIYHRDGTTQLTFRLTGNEGHTLWIDDLKSASYLTNPAGSTIDSGTGDQYFQFRVINTSSDYKVSPWLTSVTADFQTLAPNPPTMGIPTVLSDSSVQWNFTDTADNETGFKVYDQSGVLKATCVGVDLTSCTETGIGDDTVVSRKIVAYNANGNSLYSDPQAAVTLAKVPNEPIVNNRTSSTVDVTINAGSNNPFTELAIYMEEGINCDGTGGSYVLLNDEMWWNESDWGTWPVTGLDPNKSYVFCVKARNLSQIETAFGPLGSDSSGYVPVTGDYIFTTATRGTNTFASRYPDGYTPGRYVIGADNGGSPNTAKFEVRSGILTINSTDTLATGELNMTGGTVAIAQGAQIVLGQPIWIIDADGDGYSSDGKLYVGTPPSNARRKTVAATMSSNDCLDSYNSQTNVCATGGTITYSGGYTIHTFTSSGTFTPSTAMNVEVLVIGGGGGSGSNGGAGGGAGGYRETTIAVSAQAYPVTVGAGGASGSVACGSRFRGANGGNSSISTITSTGGGGGGCGGANCSCYGGQVGGSGGGSASYNNSATGGSGTSGQGYKGANTSSSSNALVGGGGGGAGAAAPNVTTQGAGVGGAGLASSITGSSITRASGGSGYQNTTLVSGGGGAYGIPCTANTGGGAGSDGGNGCSGIVIVRY